MEAEPKGRRTETIKERAVYVYLPSLEMAEDWKQRAEKGGVSISKEELEKGEGGPQLLQKPNNKQRIMTAGERAKKYKSE